MKFLISFVPLQLSSCTFIVGFRPKLLPKTHLSVVFPPCFSNGGQLVSTLSISYCRCQHRHISHEERTFFNLGYTSFSVGGRSFFPHAIFAYAPCAAHCRCDHWSFHNRHLIGAQVCSEVQVHTNFLLGSLLRCIHFGPIHACVPFTM